MTETMLRTSAEKSALRHKTFHSKAINKTRNSALPLQSQGIASLKYTNQQFDMHAVFNTFLDQKSLACKSFILTIQILNLSQCTVLIQNIVILWKSAKRN